MLFKIEYSMMINLFVFPFVPFWVGSLLVIALFTHPHTHALQFCLLRTIHPTATTAQSTAYASNATNLIQNSLHLAQSLNAITTVAATESNFKSYVNVNEIGTSAATVSQPAATSAAPIERTSPTGGKRYAIAARPPRNRIVKQMLDRLLTPFVADQLAGADDAAVLKLLTSNTRSPYLIWENATRAQLVDFLERQRTQSAREQYEEVADIWDLVEAFEFDAHR